MNRSTAVEFPGTQRLHIALQVADLQRSLPFYEVLLGVAPTKVRPGYAKFEPRDPSVNLTFNQVPAGTAVGGGVSHLGVQVRSTVAVQEALRRFEAAGLRTLVEDQTTGEQVLNVPPASIVTLLGGAALVLAHMANLRCCAHCASTPA